MSCKPPCSLAISISSRSLGRGKLPQCVVRMRACSAASSASFLSAVLRAAQGVSRLVGVQRTVSRLNMCAPIRYGSYPILSGGACPALEGVMHFRPDDATLEVWNANSTPVRPSRKKSA